LQSLTEIIRRQKKRVRTLISAFRPVNVVERYRVVLGVCTRLPLSARTRHRVWSWCLIHIVGATRSALPADVRPSQKMWDKQGHARLRQLLQGDERLACPAVENPIVSFIIVLHNSAHLSLLSLESVVANAGVSYELIVVDNASTDETGLMLDRLQGAKIIRNETNVGFGPACMQAAALVAGHYLCFFNNDALLSPTAISAALANFANASVGAVGGKALLANGALQEAGNIVWSDGSTLGYGRGDDPQLPQYNFRRPVDYCSGVFLVTPRRLFADLGGFRSEFAPAYYEDVDYSMTLWQKGFQVIYEPLAVIRHYESATSGGNEFAQAPMAEHQKKFLSKWNAVLQRHYAPNPSHIYAARIALRSGGLRILYIDDRVPHKNLGAGFPRSNDILSQLVALGHHVTFSTFTFPLLPDEYSDIPREIELFDGLRNRPSLIRDYCSSSDVVWISRPHNLHVMLTECLPSTTSRPFRLIYDAEAIFSDRIRQKSKLEISDAETALAFDEFALAGSADTVVVVSESDKIVMLQAGVHSAHVIGFRLAPSPTSTTFAERRTLLFVGGVHGSDNPNADSTRYFYGSVWPAVHKATGARFVVAGYGTDEVLGGLNGPTVQVLGAQESLRPLYKEARVFVVPTRYAAGLPFKAYEAAAFGVPLVVSDVIAGQMKWQDGIDYLVADNADAFAQHCIRLYGDEALWETLRANALQRVIAEHGPDTFEMSVRAVLNEVAADRDSPNRAERIELD
jgi:O-antigen biosynthesis protein